MKSGMDALQKSSMKIGEVMYKEQTENPADASEKPQDPPKDDGIVDVDYKKMD